MKKLKRFITKNRLLTVFVVVLVILTVLFISLGGVDKTKRIYYGYKSRNALAQEKKNLGDPFKALGFTDIKGGNSVCQHVEKYEQKGKPLDCTAWLQSYRVFSDQVSKTKAVETAKNLSILLKQHGWKQGNYEIGKWFDDVLGGVDYSPDAYHYKYVGKTFCVLDFFVAYSNPNPPAVNAEFRCSIPEERAPIY